MISTDPAVTARGLLAGPSTGPEATEVEQALRSLIRSRGADWIIAAVACPLQHYPRLVGTSRQVHLAVNADRARRLIKHVAGRYTAPGAPAGESLTVLLLNDPHPFFDHNGDGHDLGEALWDLHRNGPQHEVHLFARNPLITERLLTQLCPPTSAPRQLPRAAS